MQNCEILDNDVFYGVIYGAFSVIHITDSTFEHNIGSQGGVVWALVLSTVIVKRCTFTNNKGIGLGGAVNVAEGSILVITNSVFTNNTAWIAGGGVYVGRYSRLDISKSLFDGNTAYFAGGGEGVLVRENSSVICTSSTFINNRERTMLGDAIVVYSSNTTLSNLIITQNHGACALFFYQGDFLNIFNCIFSKNTARSLCVSAVIEPKVLNCEFLSNEASAIHAEYLEFLTVSNVKFSKNVASNGGAITLIISKIYIDNCIFDDNRAYFDGGAIFIPSGNIYIQNSYFRNNTAEMGFGGIVSISIGTLFMSNCSAKHNYGATGGVIYGNECQISLTHCVFENNTAESNGGAIYIRDNSPLDDDGDRRVSRLHILNCLFSGNGALTGGAIYIFGEVLKIFNTTFSFNNARYSGIMELLEVREILLNGSVFVDNFASETGNINVTSSTFVAINSIFDRNIAGKLGQPGCLVFTHGKASLENCTFSSNINPGYYCSSSGGAITSTQCELRISSSLFDSNEADRGKDIFLENDLLTYMTSFKHSLTYKSNDRNFTDKVFQDNIFFSNNPNDVTVSETQYASGKDFLHH